MNNQFLLHNKKKENLERYYTAVTISYSMIKRKKSFGVSQMQDKLFFEKKKLPSVFNLVFFQAKNGEIKDTLT